MYAGLATLGEIGRFQAAQGTAYPAERNKEAVEAYRSLVQTLRNRLQPGVKAVLVTSAEPEEGKSTTAANLATLLAQSGSKVILVDADLRWSSLRNSIDGVSSLGLTGLLLNYLHSAQLAIARTEEDNLLLLPSGALPDDPEELLRSPRLLDVIESLRHVADYVIIDSPPILEAPDAVILVSKVDATLLVVRSGKARSARLRKALKALAAEEVRPLGAVLNRVRLRPVKAQKPEPAPAKESRELAPAAPVPVAAAVTEAQRQERIREEEDAFERRLAALRGLRVAAPEAGQPVELPSPPPLRLVEPLASTGPRLEPQIRPSTSPQLQSAVGELLTDLEAALSLIRSLRKETSK
jgi:capsular exopolysaccharide synthesis family protein